MGFGVCCGVGGGVGAGVGFGVGLGGGGYGCSGACCVGSNAVFGQSELLDEVSKSVQKSTTEIL